MSTSASVRRRSASQPVQRLLQQRVEHVQLEEHVDEVEVRPGAEEQPTGGDLEMRYRAVQRLAAIARAPWAAMYEENEVERDPGQVGDQYGFDAPPRKLSVLNALLRRTVSNSPLMNIKPNSAKRTASLMSANVTS